MESSRPNKSHQPNNSNNRGGSRGSRGNRGGGVGGTGRGTSFRGNQKSGRGGAHYHNDRQFQQTRNVEKDPPAPSTSTTIQAQQRAPAAAPFPQTLIQQHTEDRQVTYGYVSFRQKILIKSSHRPVITNSKVQARKEWVPYNVQEKAEVKLEKNNCFITNENQLADLDFIKQLVASSKVKKSEKELQGKLKQIELEISGVKQDLKSGKVPQYYGRSKPRFNNRQQHGGDRDQRFQQQSQQQHQNKRFLQSGDDFQRRVFGEDYTVRVTNLPDETKEDQIYESFEVFGKLKEVKVINNKFQQEKQQFKRKKPASTIAFVTFMNKESMQKALQQQNHVIGMLEVSISLPRPKNY